jgi:hypothetical protein
MDMRFGSIFFWMSFVALLAASVLGFKHYMKSGGRLPQNAMGGLKQNVKKVRSQYDSVLGVDAGEKKKKLTRQQIRKKNSRR